MSDNFDPYHIWLGIPLEEQPANHYRLLGIRVFEANPEVIESAADRQMAHVRTLQSGKHALLSQRLLNELSAARVCLLIPQTKATYDQQLRAAFAAAAQRPGAGSAVGLGGPPLPGGSAIGGDPVVSLPVAQPIVATIPQAAPQPSTNWDQLIGDGEGRPRTTSGQTIRSIAARRASNNRLILIGLTAVMVLAAAGGIVFYALNANSDAVLTFDWPAADRAGAILTIDNQRVSVPANGPWEYRCPPGEHHVVASRGEFAMTTTVSLEAGEEQTIAPEWKPTGAAAGRRKAVAVSPSREATLVIDWPVAERRGAQLTIDGDEKALDALALKFPLSPGRHVLRIVREGFQPIDKTFAIGSQKAETLTPIWKRQEIAASTGGSTQSQPPPVSDTANNPTAPADAGAKKKLPVPSDAEQQRMAKELDEAYKVEHTAERDLALAEQLLIVAGQEGTSPAERFMLLMKADGLSAGAGDWDLAFRGIDLLAAGYEIDPFEIKQKLLDDCAGAATTADQVAAMATAAELLIDQALADERYDTALEFAATADKALGKPQPGSKLRQEMSDRLARRRRKILLLQTASAAAIHAETILEKDRDNAEANSTLGRWYCLCRNDFDRGLPLLVKGANGPLKSVAQQELGATLEAKDQIQLADAWWEVAQKETGLQRDAARLHAGEIYRLMLPNLEPSQKKTTIEKRLAEIAALEPRGALREPSMKTASSVNPGLGSRSGSRVQFPLGQWVDVLKLVDTTKDTVSGRWSQSGGEISCKAKKYSRIKLPVAIDGSYDLEVEFTRTEGTSDVNSIIPIGSRQCMVSLSASDGKASGLDLVDGHGLTDHRNPATTLPGMLENGHRYKLHIEVRILKKTMASVAVTLDGRPYLPPWEGKLASLSCPGPWSLPDPQQLGLGGWKDRVTFHSVRLRLVVGRAVGESAAPESIKLPPTSGVKSALGARTGSPVQFPPGQWVDVLRLIDTTKHAVKGNWSRNGSEISCEPEGEARVEVPMRVDGSYDLEVEFTRTDGDADVNTVFTVGGRQCAVLLSMDHGGVSGLDRVDGLRPWDNGNPTAIRPGTLTNGQRYRLLVNVRVTQPDHASVDTFLDGKPYLSHWEGNPASLALDGAWRLPDSQELGLATWNTRVVFQSMRLRSVAGRAVTESTATEIIKTPR